MNACMFGTGVLAGIEVTAAEEDDANDDGGADDDASEVEEAAAVFKEAERCLCVVIWCFLMSNPSKQTTNELHSFLHLITTYIPPHHNTPHHTTPHHTTPHHTTPHHTTPHHTTHTLIIDEHFRLVPDGLLRLAVVEVHLSFGRLVLRPLEHRWWLHRLRL